jgi:hypothetical protein
MKVASWIMFALFCVFVAVQLNDPDPEVWVLLYAASAVLSLLAGLDRLPVWPIAGMLVVYLGGILWLAPSFVDTSLDAFGSIGMSSEREELVRELWGLVICAVWCGALLWDAWRKRVPSASDAT